MLHFKGRQRWHYTSLNGNIDGEFEGDSHATLSTWRRVVHTQLVTDGHPGRTMTLGYILFHVS